MLIHSVYFWFKPNTEPTLVETFEAGLRRLTSIPEVQQAYFGRPEATPQRDVVDHTYTWALVEIFADLRDHERYQEHPLHHDFFRDFAASWERVQVYDVRA